MDRYVFPIDVYTDLMYICVYYGHHNQAANLEMPALRTHLVPADYHSAADVQQVQVALLE